MKTIFLASALALCSIMGCAQDKQPKSPPANVKATVADVDVEIHYSQPSVKGREIWGDLVPYGKVWRTGANEATTISFSQDVMIDGQALPAGKYALFTIPTEDNFTFIFNKEAEQWGAYKYKEKEDALRVVTEATQVQPFTEMLSFNIQDDGHVLLNWANLEVAFIVSK
jgi:hypothetical protein